MVSTLLDIDIANILEALEEKTGVKLPRRVIDVSLVDGVLHIRFNYPKTRETDVEPFPLKTPTFLFKDEETGEITALETVDIDTLLTELGQPMKAINSPNKQRHSLSDAGKIQ